MPSSYSRKRRDQPANIDELIAAYRAGQSLTQLSRRHGVSIPVLRRWLTQSGVAIRGRSEAGRRRSPTYEGVPAGCPLTARQLAALRGLARGLNHSCVAAEMGITHQSVWHLVSRAAQRLGATSALQAIVMAREAGWLDVKRPPVDGDEMLTDAQREYVRAFTVLIRTSPTARRRLLDGILDRGSAGT